MEIDTIDNLSEKILKRLKDNREVRDEQISLFLEWTLSAIGKFELLELPRNFFLLKENVFKCRMYNKIEELETNQAFVYGSLWSTIKLIELDEKRKKDKVSIEVLAKKYIKNIEIFQTIESCQGIKHKDLAYKCGKTPSELSQFFNQVGEERFISSIRLGREKYYYLEERGTCLLEQMKKLGEPEGVNTEFAATESIFDVSKDFSSVSKDRHNF